jgi:PH/SEC7 domain-containing protein
MFRSPASSPRSLVPPSSFPSGLQPNASRGDRNGNRVDLNMRRSSRIDMSFEQALEAGETMVIKEGIDFDSLGLGEDSAPALKYLSSTPPLSPPPPSDSRPQTMVPPRAKNSLSSSTPRPPASISASTSASSSSNDLFYDAEDPDYQTKRRSMYRSQGTASSPDLATLVRKAKQRASILPASNNKDKRHEVAPPLPASSNPYPPPNPAPRRHRQRSSTSSSGHTMPGTTPTTVQKSKLQKPAPSTGPSSGVERVPPTSSGHDDGGVKASASRLSCPLWGAKSNSAFEIFGSAEDNRIHRQDVEPNSRALSTLAESFSQSST